MKNLAQRKRLLVLKNQIEQNFTSTHWEEIGLLEGITNQIRAHPRLFRSLSFGDDDYGGNIVEILTQAEERDSQIIQIFEDYLNEHFEEEGFYASAKFKTNKITFSPDVFDVPPLSVQTDLVSVMMPFDSGFTPVYRAIQSATATAGMQCSRADDFWEESVVVQDIFNLIFRSQIVVDDFTGKHRKGPSFSHHRDHLAAWLSGCLHVS